MQSVTAAPRRKKPCVLDQTPCKALRRQAESAARYCPNHVIRIEDLG